MCGAIFHGIQAQFWLVVVGEGLEDEEGEEKEEGAPRRPRIHCEPVLSSAPLDWALRPFQDLGALVLSPLTLPHP